MIRATARSIVCIAIVGGTATVRAAPAASATASRIAVAIPSSVAPSGSALPAGHPPTSELPPGHPPISGAGAGVEPPTNAAAEEPPAAELPPGHPAIAPDTPVDGSDTDDEQANVPAGHPAMNGAQTPKDSVDAAPDLPPGTIEVRIADANGGPLPNIRVRLGLMRQDVATGNSREERAATTDANGIVTFRGLPNSTDYSYRATVDHAVGSYASEPFRLDERTGQRAVVHVYPITRDIRQALVGMRGVVFVQPREDTFQIEATIQVLNIGAIAWVPDQVHIDLPDGAKAFRTGESMHDTRVERDATGEVSLLGTFSPGEHEVTFQYQLDNAHEPTQHFRMGLPPHVAEMRVYAEGPRGMALNVSGFPPAERTLAQNGTRLLATGRRAERGGEPLNDIDVSLENLPVPSPGRWYAALLALGAAVFGVWSALFRRGAPAPTTRRPTEFREAEALVLDELVALERLERDGSIGPRAYAETRAELLDALSRLLSRGTAASS